MKFENDYQYVKNNINNVLYVIMDTIEGRSSHDLKYTFSVGFKNSDFSKDIKLNETNFQKMIKLLTNKRYDFISLADNRLFLNSEYEIYEFCGSLTYPDFHRIRFKIKNNDLHNIEFYFEKFYENEYKVKFNKDIRIVNSGNISDKLKYYILDKMLECGKIDQKFYERKTKEIKFKNI